MTPTTEVEALIAEIEYRSRIYEWDYEDQAKFVLSRETTLHARVKELEGALESLRLPHGKLEELGDDHCCHHLVEQIDKALSPRVGEERK